MHYISRFIAGFAIGFSSVWQISLVTLSIVPLIALAGGIYAFVAIGLIARVRKSYIKAGEIAEEVSCLSDKLSSYIEIIRFVVCASCFSVETQVIGNVRTVQAFTGEERAVKLYREALQNTFKYGRKAGLTKGLGLGSLHCVLFLSWALLVWFTSVVVHKDIADGGKSFTTMLNVVIAGLYNIFLSCLIACYPRFLCIFYVS